MPVGDGRLVEIEADFCTHNVCVQSTDGASRNIPLADGQSISTFYRRLVDASATPGVSVTIKAVPFDAPSTIPFAEDTEHDAYDASYVERFWQVLTQIQPIFQTFQGRYLGKDTPVHLFWHSFDLAYTRFPGTEAPSMPDADPVPREAYSHEVISFGFWADDDKTSEAGFYSYTYPEPKRITRTVPRPDAVRWNEGSLGALASYPYDAFRSPDEPAADLLAFLQSATMRELK
jgi:hypothetical protein